MDIVLAEMKHLDSYKDFLCECFNSGMKKYEPALLDVKASLEKIILNAQGKALTADLPKTSTYFCINNNEIIGAIRYRHGTSEYIERVIGHVGYETKPTAQGKGVAQLMLNWIKANISAQHLIITCEINNIASRKVIERCNGKYINQIYSPEKDAEVLRFQLSPQ